MDFALILQDKNGYTYTRAKAKLDITRENNIITKSKADKTGYPYKRSPSQSRSTIPPDGVIGSFAVECHIKGKPVTEEVCFDVVNRLAPEDAKYKAILGKSATLLRESLEVKPALVVGQARLNDGTFSSLIRALKLTDSRKAGRAKLKSDINAKVSQVEEEKRAQDEKDAADREAEAKKSDEAPKPNSQPPKHEAEPRLELVFERNAA